MLEPTLFGRVIAVPETRELDVFAGLLERRGATVLRCPLVQILDAPDPAPVLAFAHELAQGAFDDLILLTGEGLRRILSCIDAHEPALRVTFVAALGRVRRITRGPKPARALRELGLQPDVAAGVPTTAGVIAALSGQDLRGRRVAVQLYGTEPNRPLVDFLAAGGATVRTVAPYVYADAAADAAVRELLTRLAGGGVDAIAFTSMQQVERLFALEDAALVRAALSRTLVAAVGPVVAAALAQHGVAVALSPADAFFMKPLTAALAQRLGPRGP
jgi:uroporphyrinogen-III synthase